MHPTLECIAEKYFGNKTNGTKFWKKVYKSFLEKPQHFHYGRMYMINALASWRSLGYREDYSYVNTNAQRLEKTLLYTNHKDASEEEQ